MIRPASLSDIRHIGETMWARGKEELGWLGIDPRMWAIAWVHRINRGDAVAFGPHAILGCDREGDGVISTSFQASQSFEDPGVGRRVTTEMRREIPRLMAERGVRLACTYSLCVTHGAPKWFRLLGLTEDLDYVGIKRGPYVTRRFVRRA